MPERRDTPVKQAEQRIVRAAMAWLRWMEKVHRAEVWLRVDRGAWESQQIPNLLRATIALRKARKP